MKLVNLMTFLAVLIVPNCVILNNKFVNFKLRYKKNHDTKLYGKIKTENSNKKLLFTRLVLFIRLKSLFMDNEQYQTRVQEEKKKTQRVKRNTQTPPK